MHKWPADIPAQHSISCVFKGTLIEHDKGLAQASFVSDMWPWLAQTPAQISLKRHRDKESMSGINASQS